MEIDPSGLRKLAALARRLAKRVVDDKTRNRLENAAAQYDRQVDAISGLRRSGSEPNGIDETAKIRGSY